MNAPATSAVLHPLSSAQSARSVRVAALEGGGEFRSRLLAMGITPGASIRVVSGGAGPVVVDVLGSRLVLGHGVASRVMVRSS